MNRKDAIGAVLVLAFASAVVSAQQPSAAFFPKLDAVSAQKEKEGKQPDKEKKPPEKKLTEPPTTDIFTRTNPSTTIRDALGFAPHMLGDFPGYFARRQATVTGTQTTTTTTNPNTPAAASQSASATTTQKRELLLLSPVRGDFKVSENASAWPIDRVFFSYTYYADIVGPEPEPRRPRKTTQTSTTKPPQGPPKSTKVETDLPGAPYLYVHREVVGFEKTFLDGYASIEMRLPILQQTGTAPGFGFQGVGDLRIVGKYAFYLDRDTGDVFSGGLAVTAPTGAPIETFEGDIQSTLLQPWFGYVWNRNRAFVQGFHSVVVPTDSRDVVILFNDVALSCWLYRTDADRAVRFVIPTAEVHVTTPLNHRGMNEPIVVPDMVTLTGGFHVGIFRNSIISLGAATPITGPRTYGFEAFVQYNRRF